MVPLMAAPCTRQKYGYVPGILNRYPKVPLLFCGESNNGDGGLGGVPSVTVCPPAPPSHTHVTLSPSVMVAVAGRKKLAPTSMVPSNGPSLPSMGFSSSSEQARGSITTAQSASMEAKRRSALRAVSLFMLKPRPYEMSFVG